MNAFESLIAGLLEKEGYWTRGTFKVELTKGEKREIGRSSSPRWELDVIAYKGIKNELLVVECKSYLDSQGVRYRHFDESVSKKYDRFKLFNESILREVVFRRLSAQLVSSGLCASSPNITLCLAAGNIYSEHDRLQISDHCSKNGWLLFDRDWILTKLEQISDIGYEDSISAVVTKLLLRK
jgi:hypothetical protein